MKKIYAKFNEVWWLVVPDSETLEKYASEGVLNGGLYLCEYRKNLREGIFINGAGGYHNNAIEGKETIESVNFPND